MNPQASHQTSPSGWVLRAASRVHDWQGAGWLSLKTFDGGTARYSLGRAEYRVEPGQGFIVNHDQPYRVELASPRPVHSLCLFFAPEAVRQTLASLTRSPEDLIEHPVSDDQPPEFFERNYPLTAAFQTSLERASRAALQGDQMRLEVSLQAALVQVFGLHRGAKLESFSLRVAKAATRQELYRRLHRAREYMHANFERNLPLTEVAAVANLSVNHLMRGFQELFNISPHQHLLRCRLERAEQLLKTTSLPVSRICLEVGFESLGGFRSRFNRTFGVPPSSYCKLGDFEETTERGEP